MLDMKILMRGKLGEARQKMIEKAQQVGLIYQQFIFRILAISAERSTYLMFSTYFAT